MPLIEILRVIFKLNFNTSLAVHIVLRLTAHDHLQVSNECGELGCTLNVN